MDIFSEILGWVGVLLGTFISFPQLVKTIKEKTTKGLSKRTFHLLFVTLLCYLIRSIVINEPIFIVSNAIGLLITAFELYLFRIYPN